MQCLNSKFGFSLLSVCLFDDEVMFFMLHFWFRCNLSSEFLWSLIPYIYRISTCCLWAMNLWLVLIYRAAEQLVGIEQDPAKFTPSNTRFQRGSSSIRRRFRTNEITSTPPTGIVSVSTPVMEEDEAIHGDFYLLAKSYFDCREYRRAAHVLRDQTGKKSVFLRCYALYLVCSFLFSLSCSNLNHLLFSCSLVLVV